MFFLSEEEREERRRKKEKRDKLEQQLEGLKDALNDKKTEPKKIVDEFQKTNTYKWDYIELTVSSYLFGGKDDLSAMGGLEKLGRDGWELAGIESNSSVSNGTGETNEHKYIFKRKFSELTEEVKNNIQRCEDEINKINSEIERLNTELGEL